VVDLLGVRRLHQYSVFDYTATFVSYILGWAGAVFFVALGDLRLQSCRKWFHLRRSGHRIPGLAAEIPHMALPVIVRRCWS
jgi:hypothetical protein